MTTTPGYPGLAVPRFPQQSLPVRPPNKKSPWRQLIFVGEADRDALRHRLLQDDGGPSRVGAVEVLQTAREYKRRHRRAHANMVWTHPGM